MSLLSMLESKGNLKAASYGQDASGGNTEGHPAVTQSDVPCSVQPSSPSVQEQYRQRNQFVSHTIYFESDIGAKPGDLFECDDEDGVTHKYIIHGQAPNLGLGRRFQAPFVMMAEEIT